MIAVVLLLVLAAVDGAREGEGCTKDGVAGVCTNIRTCLAAQQDIRDRKKPQHCELAGIELIVCCVSSSAVTPAPSTPDFTTRDRTASSTTEEVSPGDNYYIDVPEDHCKDIPASLTSKRTGQKAWDKCLEYQERCVFPCVKSSALAGGVARSNRCHHNAQELSGTDAAARDEFPHMALLGYKDSAGNLNWLCAGSLVSDRFLLTAARCASKGDGASVTHVQLGRGTLHRHPSDTPARNRHAVRTVVTHPDYDPARGLHDIALLELQTPVPLDEFTVPACLHTGPAAGSLGTLVGWGLLPRDLNYKHELQKRALTKVDTKACADAYSGSTQFDEASHMCYGDKNNISSGEGCQYNGGSPLQIKNNKIACMYTIIGVASPDAACRVGGDLPGLYTSVAHYLDWIEKIVWP